MAAYVLLLVMYNLVTTITITHFTPTQQQTLDLKGREKFLGQMSVQGYVGCSHCAIQFPEGVSGVRHAVARRYLPPGHPLRRQISGSYEYPAPETAGPAPLKTTIFVHDAANRELAGGYDHYLGQKCHPMFNTLGNYSYENMNIPDWMHNLAR